MNKFFNNIILGCILFAPYASADDNLISLEQSGDDFALVVEQIGYKNEILMLDGNSFISAASLDMYLVQVNTSPNTLPNKIRFNEITGSGNQMKLGQGIDW